MSAPFYEHGLFGHTGSLFVALALGVAFGWFLERGGMGNARKLAAQFYLRDLTVFKLLFSAIVTAMLGLFWLSRVGLVDLSLVYVPPTWVLPQLVGGLVFGVGFVMGGLCPGTSCVAASSGRWDGLALMAGMLAGIVAFGEAFPLVESFYNSTPRGTLTFPGLTGLPYGVLVFVVVAGALASFAGAERIERRFGSRIVGPEPGQDDEAPARVPDGPSGLAAEPAVAGTASGSSARHRGSVALLLLTLACTPAALHAQHVDTIRVGDPALRGAVLREGFDAEASFRRVDGVDTPTSTTSRQVGRIRYAGDEAYLIRVVHASAEGDTTRSSTVVRASDFALLHHRVKAAGDSAAVTSTGGHLTGWVVLPDEPVSLLDVQLDSPVFPVEGQMPWLFPLLPLADGYAAAIPHYSEWNRGIVWTNIRVLGSEQVQLGGRPLDCWKVDGGELFPGYRITHWVQKRTRRIVQSAARGPGSGPEYWARAVTP